VYNYGKLYVILILRYSAEILLAVLRCTSPRTIMMTPPLNALHAADSQPESNPWSDSVSTPPSLLVTQPLHTPDPDVLDGVALGGINADDNRTPKLEPPTHTDTFDTFDPQAHHEELSAREAWANAEGHPAPASPPIQDPDPDRQSPPQEPGAPSSSSTFASSFSSLARSFALPSLPNMNISLVAGTRTRPQSIDTADVLPTPIIAGSFASQQDAEIETRGSPKMGTAALVQSLESAVQMHNVLRRENLSRERPGGKDKDPPFDFQKFLDQMKTKSAEPVARYLRSSVPSPHTRS
jgi:Rab5 GDP/GTP exchange factor